MRACVPYDLWTTQILEEKRHTSSAGVNFGWKESARVCPNSIVRGFAVEERPRVKGRQRRNVGTLRSIPSINVSFGFAECTVLLGLVGKPLSFFGGICAGREGENSFVFDALVVELPVTASTGNAARAGVPAQARRPGLCPVSP